MAQEQLANQQQYSQSTRCNTIYLVTLTLTLYQIIHKPLDRRRITLIITMLHNNNASSLDDVLMPNDDAVNASDSEMDEIDRELEEFKRFCLMTKPLENHPKVAMGVNLKDPADTWTQVQNSQLTAWYCLDCPSCSAELKQIS